MVVSVGKQKCSGCIYQLRKNVEAPCQDVALGSIRGRPHSDGNLGSYRYRGASKGLEKVTDYIWSCIWIQSKKKIK